MRQHRLGERLDVVGRRVGVDLVRHLDAAEAVEDVAVDPKDYVFNLATYQQPKPPET